MEKSSKLILHKDYGKHITLFSKKTLTTREKNILYMIIKYTSPYSKNIEFNKKEMINNEINVELFKKNLLDCFNNEKMIKGTVPFYAFKGILKSANDIYKKEFWKILLKFSQIQAYNIGNNVKNPFIYNLFSSIEKGKTLLGENGIKFEMNYKFVKVLINDNGLFYKLDIFKTKKLKWYETQLVIIIENKHGVGKNKQSNNFNYKLPKEKFKDMIGMKKSQYQDTQNFQKFLFKMKININNNYKTIKINNLELIKDNINSKIKNIVLFKGKITKIKDNNNFVFENKLNFKKINKENNSIEKIMKKLKLQKSKHNSKIKILNNPKGNWTDYQKDEKLIKYNEQIKIIDEIIKIVEEEPNLLFINKDNELGCFYNDDGIQEKGEYRISDIEDIRWYS